MLRPGRQVHLSGQSLAFRGCKPHISLDCSQARGRSVRRALDQGHFYLQVEKKGSIFRQTTCPAYQTFTVSPDWVTGLWQGDKINKECAEQHYVQCKRNIRAYCENLKYHGQKQRELYIQPAAAGCCSRALAPTAERASGTTRSDAAVLATVHAAYASPKILGAEWHNAPGEDCLCTVSLWRRSHVWNQLFRGVGARHEGIWCATAPVCGVWWS